MQPRVLPIGVVFALLAFLASCGDGPCGEIYDKMKKCWEEEGEVPPRDAFIAACKMMQKESKQEVDTMAACSKKGSCEEVKSCMSAAGRAEYAKEQVAEVKKHVDAGEWKKAWDECRYATDSFAETPELGTQCERVFTEGMGALMKGEHAADVASDCRYAEEAKKESPAFAKACGEIAKVELETRTKAALAARDAGSEDYAICFDLQSAAEMVSPEEKARADALCAELEIARNAKKGLEEARTAIAGGATDISYYCRSAAEDLAKLEPKSEWATRTLDEVLKTCFLDHGKVILAKQTGSYCEWSTTQIREAAATYQLAGKDADFDAALAKTDKVCKQ